MVSWTGMRGVVTLAAAAAIPVTTVAGEPFPERATIQAIAFVVSVGTLLIQGWTLPLLIRRLRLASSDDDHAYDREENLQGRARGARRRRRGARRVSGRTRRRGCDPRVLAEIRSTIARHSQDADEMPDPEAHTLRAEVFSALYRDVLSAQRAALIAERDVGPHRRRGRAGDAGTPRPAGGRCVSAAGESALTSLCRSDLEPAEVPSAEVAAAEVAAAPTAAAVATAASRRQPQPPPSPPPSQPPPSATAVLPCRRPDPGRSPVGKPSP